MKNGPFVIVLGALVSLVAIGKSSSQMAPVNFILPPHVEAACGLAPEVGKRNCLALVRTDARQETPPPGLTREAFLAVPANILPPGGALQSAAPVPSGTVAPQTTAIAPADLAARYHIQKEALDSGGGQIVAIIDAYDDPSAYTDLFAYRTYFNLKPCLSTGSNPCFREVDETGKSLLGPAHAGITPQPDQGWALEISLDLDMVSAICQNCNLLLVEAATNSTQDLDQAIKTAITLGARIISNSYGSPSDTGDDDPTFDAPGIVFVASAGDTGYGPEVPASYPNVVSVGGTTFQTDANAESVWPGTGSGCSHISKPAWQTDKVLPDGSQGCEFRSQNDIAAVADPNTPVAVYDSYYTQEYTNNNWNNVGGTSAAAPIIAAMYALAGKPETQHAAKSIWENAGKNTNHIYAGSNGSQCPEPYMCAGASQADRLALPYSGPVGWGTPNSLAIFSH